MRKTSLFITILLLCFGLWGCKKKKATLEEVDTDPGGLGHSNNARFQSTGKPAEAPKVIATPKVVRPSGSLKAKILSLRKKQFAQEARGVLKAIGDGAQSWYEQERSNANGDRVPRHFPNGRSPLGISKRGTYTHPPKAPCANGKPVYTPSSWAMQPWRSLKFGFSKTHYGQYTYIVNNEQKGRNPSFTVIAKADLDCSGRYFIYRMVGQKDPNGEIIRKTSKPFITTRRIAPAKRSPL